MKKIGILGGTFSPIHLGHVKIALAAYEQFDLDEVLFIPSGISYMKRNMDILDASVRCELTSLAIKDYPFFKLDTIETDRGGNSYTYETLQELKKRENADYYFIAGADTLFSIEKWKEPGLIFSNCILLIAKRFEYDDDSISNKIEELKRRFKCDIRIIDMPFIDISSTEIRNRIINNENIHELVSPEMEDYIKEKGIYL